MRLFVAPLLALALAGAPRPPEPRPVVLLVHGRGVFGLDSAGLRKEWKRALDAGLARAGVDSLRDEDVRLAWYADELDPAGAGKCVTTSDTSELDVGELARGLMAQLGSELERDSLREGRSLLGDVLFVMDPATRCGARRRVDDAVRSIERQGRPVIVVAYSLGSVVTYDLLNTGGDARQDALRLVTIGSPLGVPALRDLLVGQETGVLRVPAGIVSWANVYDPDDPFAAPFAIANGRVKDYTVIDTGVAEPHAIGHYLRDPQTGAAVARALCGAAPRAFVKGCARL